MSLIVDPEFKALIPPLTPEERSGLEEMIKAEGCRDALITWHGIIIDGHNRYEICTRNDIEYRVDERDFSGRDDVKIWIIKNQFSRRNLPAYERGRLAILLKQIIEPRAKEKERIRKTISQTAPIDLNELNNHQRAIVNILSDYKKRSYATPDTLYFVQDSNRVKIGCSSDVEGRVKDITKHVPNAKLIGQCPGGVTLEKDLHSALSEYNENNEWFTINKTVISVIKAFIPGADFTNVCKVRSSEESSKIFGISRETLRKVEKIEEKAPEEVKEKLSTGEMSINEAYKEIRKAEKEEQKQIAIESLNKEISEPSGLYHVLVIDPPWQYEKRSEDATHRSRNLYPTMSISELMDMEIPAEENSVLWLWTTNAFLHEAYHIIEEWNFTPKTVLTWVKDRMGMGDWLRGKTEHCILAIRGKPVINLTNQTTVLNAPLREHSRKPDEFYQMISDLCPGRKIDIFSRESREGWDQWGCENDKF
jgi:N6-adenosine-specific RNA methylase IME4